MSTSSPPLITIKPLHLLFVQAIFLLSVYANLQYSHFLLPFFQAFFGIVVFWLAGFAITAIFPKQFHQHGRLFIVIISLLNAIFIPALIIVLFAVLTTRLNLAITIFSYSLFLLLPFLLKSPFTFAIPKFSPRQLLHPVPTALIIIALVLLIQVTRYPFLPGPDTYTIILQYQADLANQRIMIYGEIERFAFEVLSVNLTNLTSLNLYLIYKYVLPFLLPLTIFPIWPIARHLTRYSSRLALLLIPLASPGLIQEMTISRHHIIFLFFLYFFTSLLWLAHRQQQSFFFYLAGLYSFFGLLFHPVFSFLAIIWSLTIAIFYRHTQIKIKYIVLFLIALVPLIRLGILNMATRIYENIIGIVVNIVALNWNFAFPASYRNFEGVEAGWSGFTGVTKYYTFYFSPYLSILAVALIFALAVTPYRHYLLTKIKIAFFLPLTLLTIIFILIAEILPRLTNIAYLPDRALIYLSILSILPAYYLLRRLEQYYPVTSKIIASFLLTAVFISISGITYVNYLLQFTIPDYEMNAAAWIRQNLPPNRQILASSSNAFISYYTRSTRIGAPAEVLTNYSLDELKNYLINQTFPCPNNLYFQQICQQANLILAKNNTFADRLSWIQNNGYVDLNEFTSEISELDNISLRTRQLLTGINNRLYKLDTNAIASNMPDRLYIYFAKPHPKNPFVDRPYLKQNFISKDSITFPTLDNYPQYFTRIYQQPNVIIWEISPDLFSSQP